MLVDFAGKVLRRILILDLNVYLSTTLITLPDGVEPSALAALEPVPSKTCEKGSGSRKLSKKSDTQPRCLQRPALVSVQGWW
jgi:hypothetical protein